MKNMRKSIRHRAPAPAEQPSADADAQVDLHGLNCVEAEELINMTLQKLAPGDRLLVIHGKGTGVLKGHIRKHLAQHHKVRTVLFGEHERFLGKDGVCMAVIR